MKKINKIIIALFIYQTVSSQNSLSLKTQVEVGVNYVIPFFNKGKELIRAKQLRNNSESYFAQIDGSHKNVSKYSNSSGYTTTIGFYKPLKWVKGLSLVHW